MKMIYYDARRNKHEFTREEIIAKINASISEIKYILTIKKSVDTDTHGIIVKQRQHWNNGVAFATPYIPAVPYYTASAALYNEDHICTMNYPVTYRGPNETMTNAELNNKAFIDQCTNLIGELQKTLSLYRDNDRKRYAKAGITLIENVGANDWAIRYLMHDDRLCHKCDAFIAPNQPMLNHQATKACKVATANVQTTSAGMVRLTDQALINTVLKLNIEHKEVPTAIDFFAPKWVVDAYKVFKDNATGKKKFGGMKLEEYMKTVAMETSE